MDGAVIFVRNLPDQTTEKQLKKFFQQRFRDFGIDTFDCHKLRSRGCALLTVLDPTKAQKFLNLYGSPASNTHRLTVPTTSGKLNYMTRPLYCQASRDKPDKILLQTLQKEAKDKATKSRSNAEAVRPARRFERKFGYTSLCCGLWDYRGSDLDFVSHFQDLRRGNVMFGKKALALLVSPLPAVYSRYRMDFPYSSIQSITTGNSDDPSITLTLSEAPRIYEEPLGDDALTAALNVLSLQHGQFNPKRPKRTRITSIRKAHDGVVGSCFVYRMLLSEPSSLGHVYSLLRDGRELPPSFRCLTSVIAARTSFNSELAQLLSVLSNDCDSLDFGLKFQVQRLAQNGYLAPARVIELLPEIILVFRRSGITTSIEALRKLFKQLPFPGPETEAKVFSKENLIKLLSGNEEASIRERSFMFDLTKQHSHIGLVYKAIITPTGTYLEGPEPEAKNRVLRKYSDRADYFIRVSFLDEDGEPMRFDRFVSLDKIYSRIKNVLEGAINIAGRKYEFLGFSHSSLREQTTWFMAPFVCRGELLHARGVIARLGDFSSIRSPAKCAARIGQAFSDTNGTVDVLPGAIREVADVERSGRVFSDGCGTISLEVLQRLWEDYAPARGLKPTLFQIRLAGAKGMLSLDSRLVGEVVLLRPSMIKFNGSDATDIEICGSGARRLPMYLNRQYIKIMEDLGVKPEAFMELQDAEVERLRQTTLSPINAASFLDRKLVGKASRLPWLVRKLHYIGLAFLEDPFLRNAVELAVLMQLRELKHRSRILVEQGVTLYGIMDETNTLAEGSVYVCTDKHVILGKVTITRAPALHPGDIQVVDAVDVPDDSPLNALHNCVVFSQRGQRDLPSQLSGGDLDGDLYNVIYHPDLQPTRLVEPADYPRVTPKDIGRPVERNDMTDFFVQFMENDQLGRIATLHLALADRKELGTRDPDCITLAEMHSTAVDFSKSGIPVDMSRCPKYDMYRPDFMAPGPHVVIDKNIKLIDGAPAHSLDEDDEDIVSALDPESKSYRYYESQKVLGKLYRAIDEETILAELQKQARDLGNLQASGQTLMGRLWGYIARETRLVQWEHHRDWARDIRDAYETTILDTMYDYSPHPSQPLTELEVFVGTVLGKNGGLPSKRIRETSTSMKEKFERDVAFTVDCIVKGTQGENGKEEALERSIACLSVALEDLEPTAAKVGKLESFRYVAAAVCLKEVENFQKISGLAFPLR